MEDKKLKKFQYNPEAIDITIFGIVVDHLHWKLLCKQAAQLNTSVEHLWAMILEGYLINTGALDPKAPTSEGYVLPVTIRELRDNPNNLFNWRQNNLLYKPKEPVKDDSPAGALTGEDEDDLDFLDLA